MAEELFDLCDEWGRPLGRRKARSLVHRDGDWHRSFHCWLVDPQDVGGPSLLLQRRALGKDTWPGLWDVSVAGHYAAGEGIEGGLREIREEIGLQVEESELILAGWRREEAHHENGLTDREVQDVYLLVRHVALESLRPDRAEVIALACVPAAAVAQLADGTLGHLTVPGGLIEDEARLRPRTISLTPLDLVPRTDGYYGRVTEFAVRLATSPAFTPTPEWW